MVTLTGTPILALTGTLVVHLTGTLIGNNIVGIRSRGTLGDIDPLNKVSFQRTRTGVKSPLRGLPTTA